VARDVEDGEPASAQIDRVSVLDELGRGEGAGPITRGVEARRHAAAKGRRLDLTLDLFVGKATGVGARVIGVHRQDAIEVGVAADVVKMGMGIQDGHGKAGQLLHDEVDLADAEPGVEEERAPGAEDEVGDHLLELKRLADRKEAAAQTVDHEPVVRQVDARQALVARSREEVTPARHWRRKTSIRVWPSNRGSWRVQPGSGDVGSEVAGDTTIRPPTAAGTSRSPSPGQIIWRAGPS
jgi:hypothetical protein